MTQGSSSGDMPQALPNSTLAIISLVAGILGISLFPIVGSIVAVITGYMAKNEIRDSAGTLGGDGLATAGLVLGWAGIALTVIGLCIFGALVAVPACAVLFGLATEGTTSLLLPAFLGPSGDVQPACAVQVSQKV